MGCEQLLSLDIMPNQPATLLGAMGLGVPKPCILSSNHLSYAAILTKMENHRQLFTLIGAHQCGMLMEGQDDYLLLYLHATRVTLVVSIESIEANGLPDLPSVCQCVAGWFGVMSRDNLDQWQLLSCVVT